LNAYKIMHAYQSKIWVVIVQVQLLLLPNSQFRRNKSVLKKLVAQWVKVLNLSQIISVIRLVKTNVYKYQNQWS
jgi:hypothetical protein